MKIKENCKRQIDKNIFVMYMYAFLFALTLCNTNHAHFIQIDHNEFRTSGFPRPALLPPLTPIHQLPQQLPSKELTAAEFMVDLSNDLTYRILHYHSILNRNNFAFSPTALMSVLMALYEGSAGRSTIELRNVLKLPKNSDVIRVGYRDIHRRLRTYFFGSENPLKGLSLNKDNITITQEYETILMFYGYDLGMDMISSNASSSAPVIPTIMDFGNIAMIPVLDTNTTMQPEASNVTEIQKSEETKTTTEASVAITNMAQTTEIPRTSITIVEMETTSDSTTITTITAAPTTPATSDTEIQTTSIESVIVDEGEAAELISSFVAAEDSEPLLRIQKVRVSRLPIGKLQTALMPATPKTNYLPSSRSRLNRNKRHLLKELDASLFVTLFNSPSHHSTFPILESNSGTALTHITNDYELDVEPHFLSTAEVNQNYNTDVISHVFYLGHQEIVHTTFKVYNAVLYYKYFDNLKMNVLELELDTPEYNLIILLPDFHSDLVSAAASLRAGPRLRRIRKELKPRWVQAIIPDFRLHGTMYLTNDMQNMGICDIFEPNRADFRQMTDEKGIYVKHIEQSINVNIRTHPINQLKRNDGAQAQPIQISVNHPFLFFIIDRDLDVAVMAGRILNPLNVRIQ